VTGYDTDEIPTDIPADLADAVRHAAATVPAGRHSLADMHRRRRVHQRRRTAAVAGVATVAVAAGVAGVPALFRSLPTGAPSAGPAASATTAPAATAAAQRLVLDGAYATAGNVGVTGPKGVVEVAADGRVVAHPVVGMDTADSAVMLPDGRYVILGPRDLRPGVRREDGVDVTDLEQVLAFLTADGTPTYSRDVRVMGETVRLVGATADGAYLLRGGNRLVFHAFGSGAERPLAAVSAVIASFVAEQPDAVQNVSVQGDHVFILSQYGAVQTIHIADITVGGKLSLPQRVGGWTGHVRLSPDGRTVAFTHARPVGDRVTYVLVSVALNGVGTREVGIREQEIFTTDARAKIPGDVSGLAFTGNGSVRVAWYALPADANRVYELSTVLKVASFHV
jgi:hypothetical protein